LKTPRTYRAIASARYKRLYTDRYREPQNHHELDWTNAVLYIGLDEFREIAANKRKYTDWLVDIGDRNGWRTWMRIYHADDQAVRQVWLSLYEDLGDPAMEVEVYRQFNHILRYPETGSLEFDKKAERLRRSTLISSTAGAGVMPFSWHHRYLGAAG
jgi:rhamnogalacturonyl hydrolase YesR